jgi:hypothetical protein
MVATFDRFDERLDATGSGHVMSDVHVCTNLIQDYVLIWRYVVRCLMTFTSYDILHFMQYH